MAATAALVPPMQASMAAPPTATASAAGCGAHHRPRAPHAVTIPHLSFATDLLFSLDHVRAQSAHGLTTQSSLIAMLKSRIALERHYANELSRMAQQSRLDEHEHGTMQEALGKLRAQYLNTSVQHRMLANNLEEDVLQPIEALHVHHGLKAQNLTKLVNNIKKQAKTQEDAYKKDQQAFDRHFREATAQFAIAMDAGFSSTLIEEQYHAQLAVIDCGTDEMGFFVDYPREPSTPTATGLPTSPVEWARPRQKSGAAAMQSLNNNSQKLVNWLLSSEQQRRESLCNHAVKALETAELARRKCQQSWEHVEQSRIDMYRALQSVLTEYQQMAEHRISNLATNLRKHVVFESSALANEQYDWQMIASKIENVDFEGDIRDFIMENFSHDLESMTVNDLCNTAAMSSLVLSPNSKPSRPLKKSTLQISDLAMRRVPYDYAGNSRPLSDLLVTRLPTPTPASTAPSPATMETCASSSPGSTAPAQAAVGRRPPAIQCPPPAFASSTSPRQRRELQSYRVCLAQDVARAIAKAYELRALVKNGIDPPIYGNEPENNGLDAGQLPLAPASTNTSGHDQNAEETPQSNDLEEEAVLEEDKIAQPTVDDAGPE